METMQLWHEHSVNFLKAHQALCFFSLCHHIVNAPVPSLSFSVCFFFNNFRRA